MFKKTLTASIGAAAVLVALAGCSAGDAKPTPKPTPTSSSTASTATETIYNECIDGQATILLTKLPKDFTLEGDCGTVSIVGAAQKGHTITLPKLDLLVIEGNGTDVTAPSIGKVVFAGNDNTVRTAADSEVQDEGTGNKVDEH